MKNKKLRILFRVSGGRAPTKELGFGHIFRVINLAKSLNDQKLFFLIEDFGGVKKIFPSSLGKLFFIKKNTKLISDIDSTISFIQKNEIDVLVIDKYKIPKIFLTKTKKYCKVVYISDLKNIEYPADLIVNGFIGFKNSQQKNKFGTPCLLGPSFQILHPKFSKKSITRKKYDLLLTFGGFDESNIIENILNILLENSNFKIKLILGPGTVNSSKITKLSKIYRDRIVIVSKVKNLYTDISSSKYGICSGGITTYEFASQQVPFAIISQVKHQLTTAKEWEKRKIAKNLGLLNFSTRKKIILLMNELSKEKNSSKTTSNIDGLGSKRVAKAIIDLGKLSSNNFT